ncbi:MAG: transporter substrate-binding domain-containing protein [Undibacterium sp.]|nr:transporter substrate-binding domain-containing protein [Undibacterium sp.]
MRHKISLLISFILAFVALTANAGTQTPQLKITVEDQPPYNFVSPSGKLAGSGTEAVQAIMQRAAISYEIHVYPWTRAIGLAEHNKDTCVFSTTRTATREKKFLWIGPIAADDWVLFARADDPIVLKQLDDARKYVVGGYRGDAVAILLEQQNFKLDNATNSEQAGKKLNANRIDLWAVGSQTGHWIAKRQNIKIKPVLTVGSFQLYLACNLNSSPDLIHKLEQAMKSLKDDGTIARLQKKHH